MANRAQSEVARQAYAYFLSKGMSPHQAAALAGNMAWESGGRPDLVNPGDNWKNSPNSPHSFGIGQYNDRLPALIAHARQSGASIPHGDLRDVNYVKSLGRYLPIQMQLDFAWKEMQGPENRAYRNVTNAFDLQGATAGAIGYHRPAGWTRNNPQAGHAFGNRYQIAADILKEQGMGPPARDPNDGSMGAGRQAERTTYSSDAPSGGSAYDDRFMSPDGPKLPDNAFAMPAGPSLSAPAMARDPEATSQWADKIRSRNSGWGSFS